MKRKSILILLMLAAFMFACDLTAPATVSPTDEPAVASQEEQTGTTPALAPDANYEQARVFAGQWEGAWTNLTYGSTGGISVYINVQPDGTATFELTVTGNVFGAGDQPMAIYSGSYNADGLRFEGAGLPIFGDLEIIILYSGEVTMRASALPMANIAEVTSEGTVSGDEMAVTYTVAFVAGGEANGTATLTRTP